MGNSPREVTGDCMRTETATRILDAIAAGKIHSLADSEAVGMQQAATLSVCVVELRGMGVEIGDQRRLGAGPCAHAVDGQEKWGPLRGGGKHSPRP